MSRLLLQQANQQQQLLRQSFVIKQDGYQKSFRYVKHVLLSGISSVAMFRKLISEDKFHLEEFAGIPVDILTKSNKNNEKVRLIHQWIATASNLIKKKILKEFILWIDHKETKEIIEVYSWKFAYNLETGETTIAAPVSSNPVNTSTTTNNNHSSSSSSVSARRATIPNSFYNDSVENNANNNNNNSDMNRTSVSSSCASSSSFLVQEDASSSYCSVVGIKAHQQNASSNIFQQQQNSSSSLSTAAW